jgi:hypothetical protein
VLLAVGVVDVLAGGEDFDSLRADPVQPVENAGMQSLFYMDEGRNGFLHGS